LSERRYYDEYDEATTERCERALITLIGDLGPWGNRIYLAGGLAPRYLVGRLPEDVRVHVGTTDVDLVIGLALGDETPETYRTLQANLKKSGFDQGEPSFQWTREVDGVNVKIEFLCETDQVEPGRIFSPKGENAGAKFAAFNIRGAQLVREDFVERELEGDPERSVTSPTKARSPVMSRSMRRSSCSRNASPTSPRMGRTPTPAFSPAPEIKTRRRG
jgi:hypothetical protein